MCVGRGNGKSTLLAALALWAVYCKDESGAPQVPIVATTIGQAVRSVYGVAMAMVEAEPELESRAIMYTALSATKIVVPSTGGSAFPVSCDPDGLQGLDPSLAVCDEIGFMPIESWDSLLLASGKRPRSLVVGIGTPGFDKESALWYLRSRYLEGVELPGFHYVEYSAEETCDVGDERAWRDANPALQEGYMNVEALRTAVALSPEAHFRTFRLAQWVDGTDAWLGPDGRKLWDALRDPYTLVPGERTWVGLDVGLKRDSTALVALQARSDGRWHAICRIWQATGDRAVDPSDLMHHIRQLDALYRLEAVAYDPRLFEVPAQMLADEGLPMIELPQSLERMTPAFGQLFEAIKQGQISHDGDQTFTTQILNAVPRFNERGFTLAKAKSRGKIDACYALAMALDRAQHQKRPLAPLVVL